MKSKKISDKAKAKRIAAIKGYHFTMGRVGHPEELPPDCI
jgi:hypothetical protein